MFSVNYKGKIYPVLKVQPIIVHDSDGKKFIKRTEFLIPCIHDGFQTSNGSDFVWIDSEMCKFSSTN